MPSNPNQENNKVETVEDVAWMTSRLAAAFVRSQESMVKILEELIEKVEALESKSKGTTDEQN